MMVCLAEKIEIFWAKDFCDNKQKFGRETEKRHRRYGFLGGRPSNLSYHFWGPLWVVFLWIRE